MSMHLYCQNTAVVHPIHQSIMDGETETGVTIMYMVEKLDAGDIISQVTVPISDTDHTGSMFQCTFRSGYEAIERDTTFYSKWNK